MPSFVIIFIFAIISGLISFAKPANAGPTLLMEPATGLVLYAEDADKLWQPASLTKLMTAYIAFEAMRDGKLSPEDLLTCTPRAHNEPPSKVGLPIGGQMRVDLAIKALIVKSANDVAIMLAEKIAGSEEAFVEQMNMTAKRLGMTNTKFINPNGLPRDGQTAATTARDMAILASMIVREFPQHGELFTLYQVRMGNRLLRTHNSLLRAYTGADGMKTGFVCASGYNVVASATKNGRRLVAVVLGESSGGARTLRAAGLFEHGFAIYGWKAVFAPTLSTWPVAPSDSTTPPDLRPIVCRGRARSTRKPRRPSLKPGHRKPASGSPKRTDVKVKKLR